MSTTFVLIIVAPTYSLPEKTIGSCLESEVTNRVKVCYVTRRNTPYLCSA